MQDRFVYPSRSSSLRRPIPGSLNSNGRQIIPSLHNVSRRVVSVVAYNSLACSPLNRPTDIRRVDEQGKDSVFWR